MLQKDGELDRPKLGNVVFYNEEKRLQLNKIVHPAVREEMNAQKEMYIKESMQAVVLDIPLLFESKLTSLVERVLVVAVTPDTQLKRLMERNNFSEEEAKARIQSQMPLEEKVKHADEVINNDGTIMGTKNTITGNFKEMEHY